MATVRSPIMTAPDVPVDHTSVDPVDLLADVAARRRSSLRIDLDRPVDPALLDRLFAMAACAPNHKRTFPWRFRVLTGAARTGLGDAFAEDLAEAGEPAAKVDKARTKYERAPVMVAVAARSGDDATMTAENRDAVSAAIQTILLGATAAGLASYWSTGAAMTSARVRTFCGFDPTDTMVGLLYLGWPTDSPASIERPTPEVVHLSDAHGAS